MWPFNLPRVFPAVYCDADSSAGALAESAVKTVKSAVSMQETELKRWRRTFEANAKTEVNGEK
jgi:solute carrier family 25 (mitochondrial aspartate/glutamate transporter), member 12/13